MVHQPVLLEEAIGLLKEGGEGSYLDGTLGAGGHSLLLLETLPGARILGLDRDPQALALARERLSRHAARASFFGANFAELESIASREAPEGLRGVLLDLGLSSLQIDRPERGFSYMEDGPLDMRMDPALPASAADLLAGLDFDALRRLLREYGEVRQPGRVARAVLQAQGTEPLGRTGQLAAAVAAAVGPKKAPGEQARVFQALRIAVNGELEALDTALEALPRVLAPGGVAVILSYHSLEDRRVKQFFARESRDCLCPPGLPVCNCGHRRSLERVTPRAIKAGDEEIADNPRARSVRLRAARRIET